MNKVINYFLNMHKPKMEKVNLLINILLQFKIKNQSNT